MTLLAWFLYAFHLLGADEPSTSSASQLSSAAGFVLANLKFWRREVLGVEGGEQLMVLFVQQEQKESLDFQKYGVSFILGLHNTGQLCRVDGDGLPALEVRTG